MKDVSTLRLESSSESAEGRGVTAIRWVCAGSRSSYLVLDRAQIRIGRAAEADVELESGGVSRIHAEIYRQGSIYALRDAGSTNGSYVNGHRIAQATIRFEDFLDSDLQTILRKCVDRLLDLPGTLRPDACPDFVEVTLDRSSAAQVRLASRQRHTELRR